MAQRGIESDQEKHCSICSDLSKDPVSTLCCTQCRHASGPRPVPDEEAKKTGHADVACDEPHGSLSEDQTEVVSPAETEVDTLEPEDEPKTRADFLKHSCQITLDPNTVHESLLLSDGNRKATRVEEHQVYPSHPDRFLETSLVMSKESLTGRHYWEVERIRGAMSVAVTYKNIGRTGNDCIFGFNYKSWALHCFSNRFEVRHVYIQAAKPQPVTSRVGVYLDHSAGILSFYSVSETMTLLHRVQTTFTQPLYAGLWLHNNDAAAVMCYEASD